MSQLKTLLPFLSPYRRGLVAGLLLVVLANAFSKAAPYILKVAIDGLEDPATTMTTLAVLAGLIVGTTALGGLCRYGMRELLNG
ncbi:MAG: hypothetical protein GWM90_14015, partial [Gemmatimonadetes bacterium]|nr:hypothetical protein [Gemmatimonadota bacterium]NIQ55248.1 hypothetical protein [Gemmatimonadota bacterium]NIU75447.1 hypothetical protein [Gammaproteobacteria bacterium]NIX45184.1 hypothetical protein [Gemmatimonadota bacterium]